ncbi:hypothetical protein ACFY4I_31325 [Streptomyces scabiei]|uniref:hypothetical protein n=1 Tax=Streptomyces scabiei TaxID=1930 RepID=UPI00369C3B8F
MARVPMDVLFLAVVTPVAGLVQEPFARRLGGPGHLSQAERFVRAETLARLLVDGLLAPGDVNRRSSV